jgi:hypothetical protein
VTAMSSSVAAPAGSVNLLTVNPPPLPRNPQPLTLNLDPVTL